MCSVSGSKRRGHQGLCDQKENAGSVEVLRVLEQSTSPSCQGNNSFSEAKGKDTEKDRQILVVGDSTIRRKDRAICHKDCD